jgi:hypothetical protein
MACEIEYCGEKIGGDGILVQLDESKFGKRKYDRGHRVEGVGFLVGLKPQKNVKCLLLSWKTAKRYSERTDAKIRDTGFYRRNRLWKGYSEFKINVLFSHSMVNHSVYM